MKGFLRKLTDKQKARFAGQSASVGPSEVQKDASPPAVDNTQIQDSSSFQTNNMASQQVLSEAAPGTLAIALQNKSSSSNVFAYITGLALNNNNVPIFIQSDGRTVYTPTSPKEPGASLERDVAISLGNPGDTVYAIIPKIAGGRIWFSVDSRLTFKINPGPAIVEPSITNPSDPNINLSWTFAEFTFNDAQLFANISYVDFISVPVAMSITTTGGEVKSVLGMGTDGFDRVVNELRAQSGRDGRPWDKLIYSHNGRPLRAMSPNNLLVGNGGVWDGYWNDYVEQVWRKFSNEDIIVNTQAAAGNIKGRITNGQLSLGEAGTFGRPSAVDIFSCSTGPFQTGQNQARNAVIPRLAAAFNRSTLLDTNQFPNGSHPDKYYKHPTTNHFSRVVHEVQRDGRGYAFPYDDVVPDGGEDVAGTIFDGSPKLFTVAVGGGH
ncbi:glucanase B [Dendryphion nanum]|uniref:Glucanase B n=1 Tax=Dendryphion nanum TaxID=256645 RepID=A0A9P9E349_9PLEO|nr:glucanase B [Dendryphion nanum]